MSNTYFLILSDFRSSPKKNHGGTTATQPPSTDECKNNLQHAIENTDLMATYFIMKIDSSYLMVYFYDIQFLNGFNYSMVLITPNYLQTLN